MKKIALASSVLTFAILEAMFVSSSAIAATCDPAMLARVRFGQRGTSVANFQSCLMQAGYTIPAGATGYYGVQTKHAIQEFYRVAMNFDHDGSYIGPQGLVLMRQLVGLNTSGEGLKKISSKDELRSYLQLAASIQQKSIGFGRGIADSAMPPMMSTQTAESAGRVSDTTVQVKGIDEPDIVKVDDKTIYAAGQEIYYILMDRPTPSIYPPPEYNPPKTSLINAFPPAAMAVKSKINTSGEMLLLKDKKILAVFGPQSITAYNVADTANPKEIWSNKLEQNTSVVSSRLYNGKIYLVTRTYLNQPDPCPILPMAGVVIDCWEIYRPAKILPTDSSFTALIIDPATGKAEKELSFLGSMQDSIVYMSPNVLYITYFYPEPVAKLTVKALIDRGSGVFPAPIIAEIKKVDGYSISDEAKAVEHQIILDRYYKILSTDERLKVENNWNNQLQAYMKDHRRELEKTTIVKIPLNTFTIGATGSVPGYPVNQFALDEYEGNLRIAVTVGERSSWWWGWQSQETANDVYILNGNLSVVGSIQNLGLSERIYAARFIGDRGYLVTFRQIDPFYVLDLSNPQSPKRAGELKIPGYSSFLVAVAENKILGIGQENNQVKVAIFDVTNPANPVEKDKYILAEGWSEVLSNHRAFLLDEKHSIFFVPGSEGGYIFSYAGDKLTLAKAVSGYDVKRAVYLDDYLYVVGQNKITVFNENTWDKVKEFNF